MSRGPETSRHSRVFSGKSIVVVGINYAPESTGIAPYTTGLCELMGSLGARVTAIVGVPHYPAWSVDQRYRGHGRIEEELNGVRVIRVGHYVPSKQTAVRRGLYEGSFLLSSRIAARSVASDAVIAVSPTLSALRTGAAIARRDRAPFAAIVQDLMGRSAGQSGMYGGSHVAGVVGRAERTFLRQADQIGVISPTFARALIDEGIDAERISLLPNHSHIRSTLATRNDSRIQLGWDRGEFIILHTGNMGLKQDLGNVIESARLVAGTGPAQGVRFILMGDGSQRRKLEAHAADLPNVTFLRPVDEDLYPVALAAADILLVNERPTVADMSLPSKLTSYFTAGRPVLAAVPPDGATEHELVRSGAGVATPAGDPAGLLEAVLRLRNDSAGRLALGTNGRHYAATMLTAREAHIRLLAFVSQLMGTAPEVSSAAESSPVPSDLEELVPQGGAGTPGIRPDPTPRALTWQPAMSD
jgi:colanic acid biosynthesis glycosyl transferase WcaI